MRRFASGMVLGVLITAAIAWAASVTVQWTANTETDLAGYRLYQRTEGGVYDFNNPVAVVGREDTETVLDGIANDGITRYLVLTAFDTANNESGPSNEASYTPSDLIPPAPPSGLGCTQR